MAKIVKNNLKLIAIDLGGTKTSLAYFDGEQIKKVVNFPTPQTPNDFLSTISTKLKLFDAPELGLKQLSAIGVGAAGVWDYECILRQSLHLEKYIGFPIWTKLSEALNLPIFLKSDVELAVMGEAVYGLKNEFQNVLYINLGTGFSASLYKDDDVFTTDYSPTLRLEYLVQPEYFEETDKDPDEVSEEEKNLKAIATLSTTLINLSFILSPQIISIGGGKTHKDNWSKIIQPAIDKAMPYLNENLTYQIQIRKAKLENPAHYGALELVRRNIGVNV